MVDKEVAKKKKADCKRMSEQTASPSKSHCYWFGSGSALLVQSALVNSVVQATEIPTEKMLRDALIGISSSTAELCVPQ